MRMRVVIVIITNRDVRDTFNALSTPNPSVELWCSRYITHVL